MLPAALLVAVARQRQHEAEQDAEQLEHLGERDDGDADPQPELSPNIAHQLRRLVVGRLDRDDHVAVGDVDVEPREVLHAPLTMLVDEILGDDVVFGRADEALLEAVDVDDVVVGGVALVPRRRPPAQAVANVVVDLRAGRVAAAQLQQGGVLLRRLARPTRALDPFAEAQQDGETLARRVVLAARWDLVAASTRHDAAARPHRQRAVRAVTRAHDVRLQAALLARHAAVALVRRRRCLLTGRVYRLPVERVAVRAVAVRLADAFIAPRPDAEGGGEAGRHVEALGEGERLRVRRVDDDPHALARRHGALRLVQPRQHAYVVVTVEQAVAREHHRRPPVLHALRQRVLAQLGDVVAATVREAVEVVRVEEGGEVGAQIALASAEATVDDELVEVDRRRRDHRLRDVRREGRTRKELFEDERVRLLVLVPQRRVAPYGAQVLAHELAGGGVQRARQVRIGEELAVDLVEDVEVEVAHVADGDGGEGDRSRYHLDGHLSERKHVMV